ncbi:AzlC family ABC transporter permease [Oceanivirga miroungae]|uniref:AzlC family protein n=1 Tax=Oceanivirga miroungae TaxID=1130046 RepID=A0A6I8MCB0_9FUSO|nr:AzlC family ABC transporter permease [Oceanivirga miroungae]VWL85101.1 AzlC family protein [Oceanivirga miroungae]
MIKNILDGMRKSIPVSIAYIPYAFSLGALSSSLGIPTHIIVLMSVFVYAGSSQIIFLTLYPYVTTIWDLVIPMVVVNIRYILINLPLIRKQKNYTNRKKMLSSFLLTDESVSYMLTRKIYDADTVFGFNFLAYSIYVISTLLGSVIGKSLPAVFAISLNFCLYAILLSLLIDVTITNLKTIYIVIFTVSIKVGLEYLGFGKSLAIFLSIVIGAIVPTIIKVKNKKG